MKYSTYDYDYSKSLLENILTNRGVKDIGSLLDLDVEEENPLHFSNMKLACGVLYKHIQQGSCIAVLIDADVDGFTSSCILIQYLTYRYPNINLHIILQKENKAHGLNDYVMSELDRLKADLLIIPDAASSDLEYHKQLIDKNIQVIIADHHEFDENETDKNTDMGIIVVNNHGRNEVNKHISAVGVVYLFIKLYNKILFKDDIEDIYLDVVALGLIADSCDMRDIYTRRLTILGLDNIRNPFIKAMLEEQKEKVKTINIMSVAFYIAPLINACIRISPIEDRNIVYRALTFGENIEEAVSICVKAKSKQDRIRDKEFKSLREQIENNNLQDEGAIIVVKDDIDPAIVGLVANKISDKYKKPTIVLRQIGDTYFGSSRNCVDAIQFKDWLESTGIINWARGHQDAHGISININRLTDLKPLLPALNELGSAGIKVDKIFDAGFINSTEVLEVVENEDLWSKGIEEPLFAIRNIKLSKDDINILGKKENTIKFSVFGMDYLIFNLEEEAIQEFFKYNNFIIEAIGRFNKNIYKGKISLQFLIDEYSIKENNSFVF